MKDLIEKYVNKKATIVQNRMRFNVIIKDIKINYGKELFLVTPENGEGEAWIKNLNLIEN